MLGFGAKAKNLSPALGLPAGAAIPTHGSLQAAAHLNAAPGQPSPMPTGRESDCPRCGRKLVFRSGPVLVTAQGFGGQATVEDSPRSRRQRYVSCPGQCGAVPENHPMQVRLDQQWAEVEAKEAAERSRLAALPPPPPARAMAINPALSLPDAIDAAHDLIGGLRRDVERLTHRVTALEKLAAGRE
jgi:hypothetical protein